MSRREFLVGAPLALFGVVHAGTSFGWFQKFWRWVHRRTVGWKTYFKAVLMNPQFGLKVFQT